MKSRIPNLPICSDVLKKLQELVGYCFMSEKLKSNFQNIFDACDERGNVDEYAEKFEEETDLFIHEVMRAGVYKEQTDCFDLVDTASEDVLRTFIIRLSTITDYLQKYPNEYLPTISNSPQLVVDCLINLWRDYHHYPQPLFLKEGMYRSSN